MHILLAFPVLAFVLMIQTIIISTLPLLSGYADLMLLVLVAWGLQEKVRTAWIWAVIAGLMVGTVSALPLYVPMVGYLLITAMTRLLTRRVWQSPILAMFIMTFAGSIVYQGIVMAVLLINGTSLPVYGVVTDLAQGLYPEEVDV